MILLQVGEEIVSKSFHFMRGEFVDGFSHFVGEDCGDSSHKEEGRWEVIPI